MKRVIALSAAALIGLLAAGCANDSGTPAASSPSAATTTASTEHNIADTQFAQQMIPHHRQAVQMADLAATRAGSAAVKALAAQIKTAQDPEIQIMSGWLTVWGEKVPQPGDDPGMGGMPGMDHGSMPGMMSSAEMARMASLQGAAFDKMFLTMMIAHHTGAITMARTEQDTGLNPDAKALAAKIEKAQTAEVTRMTGLMTTG